VSNIPSLEVLIVADIDFQDHPILKLRISAESVEIYGVLSRITKF
jgi:hypothetical protein